ncbi:MAG: hypothetical protein AAF518_00085 [Spirochaetota bacterium]
MGTFSKEHWIFLIFVVLNVLMSLNCLTFFTITKASDYIKGEKDVFPINPISSKNFHEISKLQIKTKSYQSKEPKYIRAYTLEKGKPICYQVNNPSPNAIVYANDLKPCNQEKGGKDALLIKIEQKTARYIRMTLNCNYKSLDKQDFFVYYNPRNLKKIYYVNSKQTILHVIERYDTSTFEYFYVIEKKQEIKKILYRLYKRKWRRRKANAIFMISGNMDVTDYTYATFYNFKSQGFNVFNINWTDEKNKHTQSYFLGSLLYAITPVLFVIDLFTFPIQFVIAISTIDISDDYDSCD